MLDSSPIPSVFKEEGIVIRINDEHSANAKYPISVIKERIEICHSDEHSVKAEDPIILMNGGRFIVLMFCVKQKSVS